MIYLHTDTKFSNFFKLNANNMGTRSHVYIVPLVVIFTKHLLTVNYQLTLRKFTFIPNVNKFSQFLNNLVVIFSFNPFPNKPLFLLFCSTSLLKTLGEKEKLLVTGNFFLSYTHTLFSILL